MTPPPFSRPSRKGAGVRIGFGLVAALALGVSGCTSGGGSARLPTTTGIPTTAPEATPPVRPDAASMQGVCPNPVVIQLAGPPDLWAMPYVGALAVDGSVASAGHYSAALLDPRSVTPTGINVELRTSAVLAPGQSVSQAMQADASILLGEVGTVEALESAPKDRTVAVLAPWERADTAFVWDGRLQPDAITIADLDARLDAPADIALARYLLISGLVPKVEAATRTIAAAASPVTTVHIVKVLSDPSLVATIISGLDSGTDAAAASPPAGATAGDSQATRGTSFELVAETGWEPYEHSLATTRSNAKDRASCLRALVPLLQHAAVRVSREPERLTANLAVIAAKLGVPTDLTAVRATLRAALAIGILSNGPNATLGDLDPARVQQMVRALAISRNLTGVRVPVAAAVAARAAAVVDLSFTDSTIGIGRPVTSSSTPPTTRSVAPTPTTLKAR